MQHMLHHVMQSCCAAIGNATRIHITTPNITFAEVLKSVIQPYREPKTQSVMQPGHCKPRKSTMHASHPKHVTQNSPGTATIDRQGELN
jgi:hypothetical protein